MWGQKRIQRHTHTWSTPNPIDPIPEVPALLPPLHTRFYRPEAEKRADDMFGILFFVNLQDAFSFIWNPVLWSSIGPDNANVIGLENLPDEQQQCARARKKVDARPLTCHDIRFAPAGAVPTLACNSVPTWPWQKINFPLLQRPGGNQ